MVLYILFDALIALPFNFLFFYNKLTDSYKIEEDKKNIPIVIQKVDSILKPKISNTAISLQINDAELKQNLNIIDLQTEEKLKDLEKIYSLNSKEYNLERSKILNIKKQQKNNVFIAPKTKKDITNLAQNSVKNKVYETLKLKLDTCSILNRKLILSDNNDSNKLITDIIKNKLVNICNSDPDLKSFVKILNTQHPSSLKSLELLYKFIGKKLTTTTTNNNNEAVAEVANLNFNSDTERLITMSLSISIVIDILPLLLSLLYRKYNIDD
ncbi:MAG: hypothetical protein QM539_04475 [Alphaproteobacteria bacterium]|nr:hypothetical protein [Alphaproteobacteria bacterium]